MSVEKCYTYCKYTGTVQAPYLSRVCSSAGHIQGHLETVLSISTFPPQPQTHKSAYIHWVSSGVCVVTFESARGATTSSCESTAVVEVS